MGVLETVGLSDALPGISAGKLWGWAGSFAGLVALFLIVVGIFIGITYLISQRKRYKIRLHWFQTIRGQLEPVSDEQAEELVIPGTTIRIFRTKGGIFHPAGTNPMGRNKHWLARTKTGELIYFTLKDINVELAEANLDFDHSDARAQNENLRDLIDKAYTQKSKKWWQEYKEIISLAILIFVMSLSVIFVLGRAEKTIASTVPVMELNKEVLEEIKRTMVALNNLQANSGISIQRLPEDPLEEFIDPGDDP